MSHWTYRPAPPLLASQKNKNLLQPSYILLLLNKYFQTKKENTTGLPLLHHCGPTSKRSARCRGSNSLLGPQKNSSESTKTCTAVVALEMFLHPKIINTCLFQTCIFGTRKVDTNSNVRRKKLFLTDQTVLKTFGGFRTLWRPIGSIQVVVRANKMWTRQTFKGSPKKQTETRLGCQHDRLYEKSQVINLLAPTKRHPLGRCFTHSKPLASIRPRCSFQDFSVGRLEVLAAVRKNKKTGPCHGFLNCPPRVEVKHRGRKRKPETKKQTLQNIAQI